MKYKFHGTVKLIRRFSLLIMKYPRDREIFLSNDMEKFYKNPLMKLEIGDRLKTVNDKLSLFIIEKTRQLLKEKADRGLEKALYLVVGHNARKSWPKDIFISESKTTKYLKSEVSNEKEIQNKSHREVLVLPKISPSAISLYGRKTAKGEKRKKKKNNNRGR